MKTIEITEVNVQHVIDEHAFVVIDFWAPWCDPCIAALPLLDAVAARHPDVVFARIDTDAWPDLARAFGVHGLPTLLVIRERILVAREAGVPSLAALESLIERTRLVDLDDLRNELAAREGDVDAIDH